MGKRTFRHQTGEGIEPCPKCTNHQEFVGVTQQVAEDCCEVWIVCKCGYDPSQGNDRYRLEDVWGALDAPTLSCALHNCWNAAITG